MALSSSVRSIHCVADPDAGDTHTFLWDFGDGATNATTLTPNHVYADDGIYTVIFTVTDATGAVGADEQIVTVDNAAPSLGVNQAAVAVDEGSTAANNGEFSDQGDDTVALTASVGTVVVTGVGTWSWSIDASVSDPPDVLTVTAVDSDGATASVTFALVSSSVPPEITVLTSNATMADRSTDGVVTVVGEFTYSGSTDGFDALLDWGDGSAAVLVSPTGQADGSWSFTESYNYTGGGIFTVTLTLTGDHGSTSETTSAVVIGVGIHDGVLQIVGSDAADILILESLGVAQLRLQRRIDQHVTIENFDLALVERIFVDAGTGNDFVQVSRGVKSSDRHLGRFGQRLSPRWRPEQPYLGRRRQGYSSGPARTRHLDRRRRTRLAARQLW